MKHHGRAALAAIIASCWSGAALAEEIGEVSTKFNLLTPNHKIVIEAFDDPKIEGVSCYLSRAKTGGFKGMIGIAEDPSDGSITCRQVRPVIVTDELEDGEEVFKQRTSLIFKSMQVVRFYDPKRQTFAYLVYSDKIIEGSPKNSISAVPAMPWNGIQPDLAKAVDD